MPTKPDPSLTPAEWAWCAGLFEGEGTISLAKHGTNVQLMVGMTDCDVIERLDALWPSPTGPYECERPGRDIYVWQIGARDRVMGFLVGILPWLGQRRRARAEAALGLLARNRGINTDTCSRGHEMTGDNLG